MQMIVVAVVVIVVVESSYSCFEFDQTAPSMVAAVHLTFED